MKNKMVWAALVTVAGIALSPLSVQAAGKEVVESGADVRVTVASESKDLAKGFEAAFTGMTRPPISLVMIRDGKMFVIEDVGGVKALDGALRVEVGKGLTYIVNPRDVLCITDGKVPVEKPSRI